MSKLFRRLLLIVVGLSLLPIVHAPEAAAQGSERRVESYTAMARGMGGIAFGRMRRINILVESYTSDQEMATLAETLKARGAEALSRELERNERGRIAPIGVLGTDVHFARSRPTETGRRIVLASARPIAFFESYRGTRSRDYEFGIVRLDLDKEGKGSGMMIVAARVKFNDEGVLEIEQYGREPIELINVEPLR